MFNNHEMSVVTNLGAIGGQINNKDFIAVAAITTSQYPNLPNVYNASILIPPTDMLMAWVDNVPFVLQNQYPMYLATQTPDEMIIALVALLTQKNVVLYIPSDEFNVFGMMLLNHLYFTYGITCNTPNTRFGIDAAKIPLIISRFYMMDIMTVDDYLATYPANALLPEFVINKLAEDVRPFNYQATFQQYAEYFNNINASKGTSIMHPSMVKVVNDK